MRVLDRNTAHQQEKIEQLKADILAEKQRIADEEIDGWLIRRTSPFEIADHLGTMTAESKPGCSAPLPLPEGREVLIAVLEGAIQIEGRADPIPAPSFWVVREGDGRNVIAVQQDTRIICSFFLDGDNGTVVVGRQAA